MLYDAYEMQRSMLAGASAMANFGAGLLSNPANPFSYYGGGSVLASALEVFHAAALKHVPMVEANPLEGLATNAAGTRHVADAARAVGWGWRAGPPTQSGSVPSRRSG